MPPISSSTSFPRPMTISRPASERRLTRGDWNPCHCTATGEETSRVSSSNSTFRCPGLWKRAGRTRPRTPTAWARWRGAGSAWSTGSRMYEGGHFRGPRNREFASATCMFTNSRSPAHDWNPATPDPIEGPVRPIEALDESTPPTIRPKGCIDRLVHVFPVTGSPISGGDVDRRGPDHRGPRGHRRREPPASRRGCRSAWSAR